MMTPLSPMSPVRFGKGPDPLKRLEQMSGNAELQVQQSKPEALERARQQFMKQPLFTVVVGGEPLTITGTTVLQMFDPKVTFDFYRHSVGEDLEPYHATWAVKDKYFSNKLDLQLESCVGGTKNDKTLSRFQLWRINKDQTKVHSEISSTLSNAIERASTELGLLTRPALGQRKEPDYSRIHRPSTVFEGCTMGLSEPGKKLLAETLASSKEAGRVFNDYLFKQAGN